MGGLIEGVTHLEYEMFEFRLSQTRYVPEYKALISYLQFICSFCLRLETELWQKNRWEKHLNIPFHI